MKATQRVLEPSMARCNESEEDGLSVPRSSARACAQNSTQIPECCFLSLGFWTQPTRVFCVARIRPCGWGERSLWRPSWGELGFQHKGDREKVISSSSAESTGLP